MPDPTAPEGAAPPAQDHAKFQARDAVLRARSQEILTKSRDRLERIDAENAALRVASGSARTNSRLVSFLYELMRDHVQPGVLQTLLVNTPPDTTAEFTNGFLAGYAEYLAGVLTEPAPPGQPPLPGDAKKS
jgi:hypothetical protein